jgi:hypothetical protein
VGTLLTICAALGGAGRMPHRSRKTGGSAQAQP